jgi:hypothetical protein
MSREDAAAFLASAEFRAMTRDQQDEALRAVEQQSGTSYGSRWLTPRA